MIDVYDREVLGHEAVARRVTAGEAVVAARRLAVDWPACKAHGVCAELLPEIVELDEWGYPVIAPGPVPEALRRYAQRAVSSCPTMALRLDGILS